MAAVPFHISPLNIDRTVSDAFIEIHCSLNDSFGAFPAFAGELRWTVVSSDISNSDENRDNLIFCDFSPATWYQLKVSATNDAGKTMAHYNFATTKLNGGKFVRFSRLFDIFL